MAKAAKHQVDDDNLVGEDYHNDVDLPEYRVEGTSHSWQVLKSTEVIVDDTVTQHGQNRLLKAGEIV